VGVTCQWLGIFTSRDYGILLRTVKRSCPIPTYFPAPQPQINGNQPLCFKYSLVEVKFDRNGSYLSFLKWQVFFPHFSRSTPACHIILPCLSHFTHPQSAYQAKKTQTSYKSGRCPNTSMKKISFQSSTDYLPLSIKNFKIWHQTQPSNQRIPFPQSLSQTTMLNRAPPWKQIAKLNPNHFLPP
jgi:hypothetical protein